MKPTTTRLGALAPHAVALALAPVALCALPPPAHAQESALASLRAGADADPEAALRLARALRRAGRYAEAIAALRPALRGPTRARALRETAQVRLDEADFRGAQTACGQLAPGLDRHLCAARAHLVWQRSALAERELAAAARLSSPAQSPELAVVVAQSLRLAGRTAEAEAAFRAAQAASPPLAEAFAGHAALLETMQRAGDAEALWRRAVELDGEDPALALGFGRYLLRRQRSAEAALPLLERASRERPGWVDALVLLGEAQLARGLDADALRTFEAAQAAARGVAVPGIASGLGRARLRVGPVADAEAPLRQAIAQVANDAEAQAALAELLGRTERSEEAIAAWNRAIDLAPAEQGFKLRAAQHAHAVGQNALARAYLDQLLAEAPRHAPALLLRAEVAFDEGDRPAARRFYQQALAGEGTIDRARAEARINELDNPRPARRR